MTRSLSAILGASLLLTGAAIAIPAAAQAGTIKESGLYRTQMDCNLGKHYKKVQGFNVADRCVVSGAGSPFEAWTFWYETK